MEFGRSGGGASDSTRASGSTEAMALRRKVTRRSSGGNRWRAPAASASASRMR